MDKRKLIFRKLAGFAMAVSTCYVFFYGALTITGSFEFALITTLIMAIEMEVVVE